MLNNGTTFDEVISQMFAASDPYREVENVSMMLMYIIQIFLVPSAYEGDQIFLFTWRLTHMLWTWSGWGEHWWEKDGARP